MLSWFRMSRFKCSMVNLSHCSKVLVVALQLSPDILWRTFVLIVTLSALLDAFNPSSETIVVRVILYIEIYCI